MGSYFKALLKTFTFSGRTSRKEFFMFVLFDTIISISLLVGELNSMERNSSEYPTFILSILYCFGLGITRLSATSRRFHDSGKTFSEIWIYMIWSGILGAIGAAFPLAFLLQFIVGIAFIVALASPSDYLNKYGPTPAGINLPPKPEESKFEEPKHNSENTNKYFKDNSSRIDHLLSKMKNDSINNRCPNCGEPSNLGSKFCGNCGTKY